MFVAVFCLLLAACVTASPDSFDPNSDYSVFTINNRGDSFGMEECKYYHDLSTRLSRQNLRKFNPSLYFEYGVSQIRRSPASGSVLSSRIKAKLSRGAMSISRSFVRVVVGNRTTGDVLFEHSQGLYVPPPSNASNDAVRIDVTPHLPTGDKYVAPMIHPPGEGSGPVYTPVNFFINIQVDLNHDGGNTAAGADEGDEHRFVGPYFVEVLLLEEPSTAESTSSKARGVAECVRLPSLYRGLPPATVGDSSGGSSCGCGTTVVNNTSSTTEYYTTNEYSIVVPGYNNSGASGGSATSPMAGLLYDVITFGAKGDGNTDDTAALQQAVDAAAATGGRVYIPVGRYLTTQTLTVPGGVSIVGEGQGKNPRDMSGLLGSVLLYRGTAFAVRIIGDLVHIADLVVYDNGVGGGTAAGGVLVDAGEGRYIESMTMHSVLIFRFTAGTGLKLYGDAGGAVTYSSFYDVRVRNAKIGMHLHATGGGGSFVNSNSFYRGAISGGGFDFGLRIEGPGACNNNNFHGLVIEPYTSTYGHLYVTGAMSQTNGHQIRIEAAHQPGNVTMVYFAPETYGSFITGFFASGYVKANRMAHSIDVISGKFVGASSSHANEFPNAGLRGVVDNAIPGWSVVTAASTKPPASTAPTAPPVLPPNITLDAASTVRQIIADHNVLKIQISPGTKVTLKPSSTHFAQPTAGAQYRAASFGMYIRQVEANTRPAGTTAIYATFDTTQTAVVSSGVHPGAANTDWEFISMSVNVPASTSAASVTIFPEFHFENNEVSGVYSVEVTLPSFAWGGEPPQIESASVKTSGGTMFGTLTGGVVPQVMPPADGSTYYVLPKDGNVFIFSPSPAGSAAVSYPTLARLNHSGDNRFPKGTVITLLFLVPGVSIADSVYINIRSGFTSTAHCSITLLALDAGTWVELSREL